MGGGAVHDGQARRRDEKAVEGGRIGGAGIALRVRAQLGGGGTELFHKGGFAAAGTALEDDELLHPAVGMELIEARDKAAGGVRAEETVGVHSIPPLESMCRRSGWCGGTFCAPAA